MDVAPARSIQTMATYSAEARSFVRRHCADSWLNTAGVPYEVQLAAAVAAFLESHDRWSKSHIRRLAAALLQEVERLIACELFSEQPAWRGVPLVKALMENRPRPVTPGKSGCSDSKRPPRKSLKNAELRRLVRHFSSRPDRFGRWIAGYLLIASRIGWRPGEVVAIKREGDFLRAPAEKHTNGRGLEGTCEVNVGAYPQTFYRMIDAWIADIEEFEDRYGGKWNVRSAMNERISNACEFLGIPRVCTNTLRHFAIASMKRSGFSQSEIAVLVNHASNRTASERYGKGRQGIKRAKKLLGFNKERLEKVRDKARKFDRSAADGPPAETFTEQAQGAPTP